MIEKGRSLSYEEVFEELRKIPSKGLNANDYMEGSKNLVKLNESLLNGHDVWVDCVKSPRNTDTGKTWFQIYYISIDNGIGMRNIFWCLPFMRKGNVAGRHWGFSSNAIGMSRSLHATNRVFNFLKNLGGCYIQLD